MRSSFSCGSFASSSGQPTQSGSQQQPTSSAAAPASAIDPTVSKIITLPVASLPVRSRSVNNPPGAAAAKVEAEAEHLREIEGQDYLMMEGERFFSY